ncbi:MAG: hypothetical protein K1X88_09085 [Nannocystaceae bacterium]|nr:hypothetical protein [Nannocystaceae bacterium]
MQRRMATRRGAIEGWVLALCTTATMAGCDELDAGRPVLDDDGLRAPAGDPRQGSGEGVITPVVFVPTDEDPGAERIAAVDAALADVWSWYDVQLGDRHLVVAPLQVVHGQRDAATYRGDRGGPDIWALGPDELRAALGASPWDNGHLVLLVGAGLSGWAGGAGNGVAGFSVLGMESLTDPARCEGNWWCTPEFWRGTAIHELGHGLTLPHSVDPSIMAFHGDWSHRALLDEPDYPEVATVRALPFTAPDTDDGGAMPTEPDPPPPDEPPSQEPSGCGEVDYAGRCDDATLVWCEDEVLRSYDCGAVGMTCGWQDDVVGNNCL